MIWCGAMAGSTHLVALTSCCNEVGIRTTRKMFVES